jgi:hypothetical protein
VNRQIPRISGAGGGNRTHTNRSPRDFESRASTNSATPALAGGLREAPTQTRQAFRECQLRAAPVPDRATRLTRFTLCLTPVRL